MLLIFHGKNSVTFLVITYQQYFNPTVSDNIASYRKHNIPFPTNFITLSTLNHNNQTQPLGIH